MVGNTFIAHYRIYLLDGIGTILSAVDTDCPDDASVHVTVHGLLRAGDEAEIWQGAGLLGRVSVGRGG
jgi:hypothetical protein